MKPSVEKISELLAQRRDNRQNDGYWQGFLQEFHQSQNGAAVAISAPSAWSERLHSWYSEASPTKWIYGAGIVYAAAMIVFFLAPRGLEVETAPLSPTDHFVFPASSYEQPEKPDRDPSGKGLSGKQLF